MNTIANKRLRYLKRVAGVDKVLDTYDNISFTEFVTRTGGDVQTYRVYGNNESNFIVTEK